MPVESEINVVEPEEGWPLFGTRFKHGTPRYRRVTSRDLMLRLMYCRIDATYDIMRACGREILALSIDLLRDVFTGCVRCGDKNEIRKVRDFEGDGNAMFVGIASTLDRKFEKQSKEHESV